MKYRFSYLAEDEELYTKDRVTLEEAVDFIRNFKGRKGGVFVLTALREDAHEQGITDQKAEHPERPPTEADSQRTELGAYDKPDLGDSGDLFGYTLDV